jgi:hypothetical protein
MCRMNKQQAIDLLGGTAKSAAEAMGYTSVHAVYMWPDELSKEVEQRIRGVLAMQDKPMSKLEEKVTA